MRRLLRAVAHWFAHDSVKEDYESIRTQQRMLANLRSAPYQAMDRQMVSMDGSREIDARVFLPKERLRDELLLFFHGGGWVTGDIESYTPACGTMADLTGCVVVSVDYRLAPEYPFPAGLEDCYRVAQQFLEDPGLANLHDANEIVVIGDSAGANLAAAVSLLLRDRGERVPSRQILLYPVTYWDHHPETSPFDSVRNHGEDYRLTNTAVQDYMELYVPDPERRQDPLVSPLMAADLSGQPSTLLISSEFDLLRDEGEAYGRALATAGNEVKIVRVEGALHGFITLPRFSASLREAYDSINSFLGDVN